MYHMNIPFEEIYLLQMGPSSNNRPSDPIFLWNATRMDSGTGSSYDILANSPSFRMNFNIYPWVTYDLQDTRYRIKVGNLANYPFDWYYAFLVAFFI